MCLIFNAACDRQKKCSFLKKFLPMDTVSVYACHYQYLHTDGWYKFMVVCITERGDLLQEHLWRWDWEEGEEKKLGRRKLHCILAVTVLSISLLQVYVCVLCGTGGWLPCAGECTAARLIIWLHCMYVCLFCPKNACCIPYLSYTVTRIFLLLVL